MPYEAAHAFWLSAPGRGEIRPVALPEPGRGDVLVRTLRSGVSRGTETLVFRGGVPPGQYARDARAVPGGRLPRAGQVRLPQRRRRRAGPAGAARPHGLLPVPAPDGLRGAGRRRDRRARRRAARARGARRHRRDRRQRPVGRRAAGRRPRRRRRRRDGRLLRRPAARPLPGGRGHARRRRSVTGRGRGRARRRLRAAGRRRRRLRPRRPHQRDIGRAAALARPARAGGHGARPQLVRRRRGPAVAGRRVSLAPPRASARARSAPSPPPARRAARRPTGWRSRSTCCATPPSTRSSPASRASTSCPASWRGWPRGACRRSATRSPTTRSSACSA